MSTDPFLSQTEDDIFSISNCKPRSHSIKLISKRKSQYKIF